MDINKEIFNAFEVIKQGGIILYPTDTIWGLGCDASNTDAVAKIYKLKKREETKSMLCLVNSDKMIYQIFKDVPSLAWDIWELSEKPTTLVLDNPSNVASNIISDDKTLGVRLVKEPFCFKLMERMKKPLVSTSANLSGDPSPKSFKDINKGIIMAVDYVVDLHRDKVCNNVSTIIKLSLNNEVKIIRK